MLTWEFPPKVIGEISEIVQFIVHELCRNGVKSIVVYPSFHDASYSNGLAEVYSTAESIRTNLHVLHYVISISIDLVRKSSEIFYQKRGKIDIIHAHEWTSCIAAIWLKELFKKPLVISVYTTEDMRGGRRDLLSKSIHQVEEMCFKNADIIVTHSKETQRSLVNDYNVPSEKIRFLNPFSNRIASTLIQIYREVISSKSFDS